MWTCRNFMLIVGVFIVQIGVTPSLVNIVNSSRTHLTSHSNQTNQIPALLVTLFWFILVKCSF